MKSECDYRNVGSCTSLTGNIAVFQCFVSNRNTGWPKSIKDSIRNKITDAEDWLQRECSRYGNRVRFKNFCFEDQIMESIPSGPGSQNASSFTSELIRKIGYNNLDWNKTLMMQASEFQCDKLIFLIIINGKGRNFANPYSKALDDYDIKNYYIESCILFKEYWLNDYEIYSSSIAHEILHVCGAWDLYADKLSGQSTSIQKRACELLPNSIMMTVPYSINDAKLDELTAWLVGISANHKSWYESFEPKNG